MSVFFAHIFPNWYGTGTFLNWAKSGEIIRNYLNEATISGRNEPAVLILNRGFSFVSEVDGIRVH